MTHSSRTWRNMIYLLRKHGSTSWLHENKMSGLNNKVNYFPLGHFLKTVLNQDIRDGGGAKNLI